MMLGRRMDRSGVSEVVGALMLVLIVVVAASSFAVFISQKQKEVQDQQMADTRRGLENVAVISIVPISNNEGDKWKSFNFTIANLYTDRTIVNRVSINDLAIAEYDVWRTNPFTGLLTEQELTGFDNIILEGREQVNIFVNVTNYVDNGAPANSSSLYTPTTFLTTNFVKINIFTLNLNDFSRVFVPPSAIGSLITEAQWNGTDFIPFLILDGTKSVAYNNSYIVSWNWTIQANNGTVSENIPLDGSMARCDFQAQDTLHYVNLTVVDNYGMKGESSFQYYH